MCKLFLLSSISLLFFGSIFGQSSVLAQTEIPKETWYNVIGEPFIVYQDKDRHWRGWDGPDAVDVIVHGSWWSKWGEGTVGGTRVECYPDYLLRMNCQ